MGTQRDVSALSISQLAWIARCAQDTAARKLRESGLEPVKEDGRACYYDPRAALPILLGIGEGLNPAIEKARLDRARTERAEFDLAIKRGEWIPASSMDAVVIALATAASAKMQAIGTATAPELAAATKPIDCQRIVDEAVRQALLDLSEEGHRAGERLAEVERSSRAKPRKRRAASAASPC